MDVDFERSVIAWHMLKCIGARDRNRTGTPVIHEAADFKSDVSTYFTTRARVRSIVEQKCPGSER